MIIFHPLIEYPRQKQRVQLFAGLKIFVPHKFLFYCSFTQQKAMVNALAGIQFPNSSHEQ
jgi:hypothetical protein